MAKKITLAFAKKQHEDDARGFAVYRDTTEGRYLGDVWPYETEWRAHPAGSPLRIQRGFVNRAQAAHALEAFASQG